MSDAPYSITLFNDNAPSGPVTRRAPPAHRERRSIPEVFNPVPTRDWNPRFRAAVHSKILADRKPARRGVLDAQTLTLLNQAIERDGLYELSNVRRLTQRLPYAQLTECLLELTRVAAPLLERTDAHTLADLIAHLAADISDLTLLLLTYDDGTIAQTRLANELASAQRIAAFWLRAQRPACDQNLPEATAIYSGPDAIHAYVAAGNTFTDEADGHGNTPAHIAAIASFENPQTLPAFIAAGGRFHARPNRFGRTPWHELAAHAVKSATLRQFARALTEAGLQVDAQALTHRDDGGETPLDTARHRGSKFAATFSKLFATPALRSAPQT
jgi:hypothetical protein